jgi:hypothetical protein
MISGFCHKVDENCTVLGYYAVSSGDFLPMFCAATSVRNYHYFLRNSPEECGSHVIVSFSSEDHVNLKSLSITSTVCPDEPSACY